MPEPDGRCGWALGDAAMEAYHDQEWGTPLHDDRGLFELLTLEGAQAGLSWNTILRRREGYRRAFADFDPATVAAFDAAKTEALLANAEIIRNRQKVASTVENARQVLEVQRQYGSFDSYVWSFVEHTPLINEFTSMAEIPAQTPQSIAMSKALRQRGFGFVGPTICYAFMQASGLVNDHILSCPARSRILGSGGRLDVSSDELRLLAGKAERGSADVDHVRNRVQDILNGVDLP